ncbi:MAG: GT-D fold domain-containing glycosyltransferase [Acutalibacteraceae bacterium]|nr:GT-D fold domain-containing glycosyltransferase [Acutalibacteraceae bacterium]
MTPRETVEYIIENKCSMARYGDGELGIAAYGIPIGFQRADKNLQSRLIQVLKSNNHNLLLCLPNRLNAISEDERKKIPEYWQKALLQHLYPWTKYIEKNRIYGDTNLSRLTEESGYEKTLDYISYIKKIWSGRNVIMIEGAKTRFGVGNDLLNNVKSLRRILGPAESAFDYYNEILERCVDSANGYDDPLFLIALGPTATVLASDLADQGYQALDLGHLDISYEKLKSGSDDAVQGKYTNESSGGNIVGECLDSEYLSQIITKIGK